MILPLFFFCGICIKREVTGTGVLTGKMSLRHTSLASVLKYSTIIGQNKAWDILPTLFLKNKKWLLFYPFSLTVSLKTTFVLGFPRLELHPQKLQVARHCRRTTRMVRNQSHDAIILELYHLHFTLLLIQQKKNLKRGKEVNRNLTKASGKRKEESRLFLTSKLTYETALFCFPRTALISERVRGE